jgi:hypothetical protein
MDSLKKIGEFIRTQDNRYTDQPMFLVEQVVRTWGFMPGHSEFSAWINHEDDWSEADEEDAKRLDALEDDCEDTGSWEKIGYKDDWEFVTACFTEQGCKDFLEINGHNLKQPRIYAAGSWRNKEFRDIRNALIELKA